MTSVAKKKIKVIDKNIAGVWEALSNAFLILSMIVLEKNIFWPKNVLFFKKFHICLSTATSILTWPKNDIDKTCIYSNGLSGLLKKLLFCSVVLWTTQFYSMDWSGSMDHSILWKIRDSHFSKTFSRIFWVWLELSRAFLQILKIHTKTFRLSY